jgi:hypothetical protein
MQPPVVPVRKPDAPEAVRTTPLMAPAGLCPRCRGALAIARPQNRRARGVTARLCPSLSCGYKLIVPM